MSWSSDCNAVTRFQEDVARMAAGLWRDQRRATDTNTTAEPATANTHGEMVEKQAAAIYSVLMDVDRPNETVNDNRGIEDEVELLRETVQDLQANIVHLCAPQGNQTTERSSSRLQISERTVQAIECSLGSCVCEVLRVTAAM